MFLSNRRSALRLSSILIFLTLAFFFCPPQCIWPSSHQEPLSFYQPTTLVLDTAPTPVTKSPHRKSSPSTRVSPKTILKTESTSAIPEKLWYKLGPLGLTDEARNWTETCIQNNPTYKFEFLTDVAGDAYVKEKFAHRPDIVEAYLALQIPIVKADILRYLLLYSEGGVYSDLDVSCTDTPINEWVPAQYKQNTSLVVGWEFDVGWGSSFVREFSTWTIMAKPGSPHMLMVVEDILEGLSEKMMEHNTTIAGMTWAMVGDVVDLTGPRRMTRSVLKSLRASLDNDFDDKSIAELFEPMLVGDVLILPGYSFSLTSNHYKPEDKQGPVLVTHHFKGSWKNDHGGESARSVP